MLRRIDFNRMNNPLACPKCAYERKPSDQQPPTQCPNCGLIFARYKVPPVGAKVVAPAQASSRSGNSERSRAAKPFTVLGEPVWLVVLMCSFAFAIAWAYGTWSSGSKSSASSSPIYDASAAQFACQGYVQDRLKAPASAQFAPFRELAISGSGVGPWTVRGYVDAQNSFGANLRSKFSCTVEFVGSQTKLIDVSVH